MPDTNTRWVLGTLAVLAGLILQQGAATNARIDDLRADMQAGFARVDGQVDDLRADMQAGFVRIDDRLDRLEDRLQALDDRLRAVEVAFGKVDQRLETLERTVLPAPADD